MHPQWWGNVTRWLEKRNATVYLHAKGLAQSVTYREDVEVTLALSFHYTSSLCAFLPATF